MGLRELQRVKCVHSVQSARLIVEKCWFPIWHEYRGEEPLFGITSSVTEQRNYSKGCCLLAKPSLFAQGAAAGAGVRLRQ